MEKKVTAKEMAEQMVLNLGIVSAIQMVEENINTKRREIPTSLTMIFHAEAIEYLLSVKEEIEKINQKLH